MVKSSMIRYIYQESFYFILMGAGAAGAATVATVGIIIVIVVATVKTIYWIQNKLVRRGALQVDVPLP